MKRRKPYAEAFKQEAVKLVTERGMGVIHVARDLDVSLDTLHRWVRAARSASTPPNDASIASAERARLRRENAQLRMEREILKKALGIFSRMPQCPRSTRLSQTTRTPIQSRCGVGCWGLARSGYYLWKKRPASSQIDACASRSPAWCAEAER